MNHTFKYILLLLITLLPSINAANAGVSSLWLDGVIDRVRIANSFALNPGGAITIEAWIRPLTGTGCQTIVGKNFNESYWLGICDNRVRYYTNGAGTSRDGSALVPVGEWSHIAVTYNGLVLQFYINGILDFEETSSSPAPLPVNLSDLGIGGESTPTCGAPTNYCEFTGNIAEVRIWSVVRSREEIRRDMIRQIDRAKVGLIGVWHLEGSEHDALGNFKSALQGGSVYSFSGPVSPPVPYGPMRIAQLAVSPDLDGNCSTENGAFRIPIWHDDEPAVPLVWARVGATSDSLYICIEDIPKSTAVPFPFATVYIDRGADGGLIAQPADFRLTIHAAGTATTETGDGVGGFTGGGFIGDFAAANLTGSEFVWSAEFRIPRYILETRGPVFGLQLIHHGHQYAGDDHGWPVDFVWNSPDTWVPAYIDDTAVQVADTRVPVVSVEHSPVRPSVSDSIVFTAYGTDDTGVASMTVYIDDAAVRTCDFYLPQFPPWTCIHSVSLPAGLHRYYATATDSAGRVGRSALETLRVLIDGEAPTVTTWHAPANPRIGQDIVLEATATDPSGIAFIEFSHFGYRCSFPSRPATASCTYPVTPAAGQRVLRYTVRAIDAEGLEGNAGHYVLFGNSGTDTDNDGISDEIEDYLCTSPTSLDSDRDGLKDGWEVLGLHFADGESVDLPGLGANPCHRDVFLQYDYETGARVAPGVVDDVVAAYRRHGITLHVEEHERPRPPFTPESPLQSPLRGVIAAYQKDTLGNYYFPPKHNWTHYYVYGAHRVGVSGSRERFSTYDIYIKDIDTDGDPNTNNCDCPLDEPDPALCGTFSAGGWRNNCMRENRSGQAVRFMHEFGHNIGLGHAGRTGTDLLIEDGDYIYYDGGWDTSPNYKPNYLSPMNYLYPGGTCMTPPAAGDTRPNFVYDINYSETALPTLYESSLTENPSSDFALALGSITCVSAESGAVPVIMYTCADPDETNTMDTDLSPAAARVLMITDGTRTLARKKHGGRWQLSGLPVHAPGIDWNCDGTIQSTVVTENINGVGDYGLMPPDGEICGNGIDDDGNGTTDDNCSWDIGDTLTSNGDWATVPGPFPCLQIYDTADNCYWHPQTYRDEIGPGAPDCRPGGSPAVLCPDSPVIFPGSDVTIENNRIVELWPNAELCDGWDNDNDYLVDEGCRDTDADAVPDAMDNCPETANSQQADRNASKLGDVCESPSQVSQLAATPTGKGILINWSHVGNDVTGYNVYRLDPVNTTPGYQGSNYPSTGELFFEDTSVQSGVYSYIVRPVSLNGSEGQEAFISNSIDSDGDGLQDTYELYAGTDLQLWDSDGDGLADGAGGLLPVATTPGGIDADQDGFVDGERDYGTGAGQKDTDGDGFNDADEVLGGSDPLYDWSFPIIADGDLTGDGIVNVADVLVAIQILVDVRELTPMYLSHGDVAPRVNGISSPNSQFNLGDFIVIQGIALGL